MSNNEPSRRTGRGNLRDLKRSISKLTPVEGVKSTPTARIHTYRSTVSTTNQPITYPASIVLLVEGRKACFWGDQKFGYQAGYFLFVASEMTISCHNYASKKHPLLGVILELDLVEVMDLSKRITSTTSSKLQSSQQFQITQMSDDLINAANRLLKSLMDPAETDILSGGLRTELLYYAIRDGIGPCLANLNGDASMRAILDSLTILHAELDQSFTVSALANRVHLSPSRFHSSFKKLTGFTPMGYLKNLRLHRAREMILRSYMTALEASHAVRYGSTSQFSREYKRQFGKTVREERDMSASG